MLTVSGCLPSVGLCSAVGAGDDVETVRSAAAREVGGGDAVAAVVDEGDAGGIAFVGDERPMAVGRGPLVAGDGAGWGDGEIADVVGGCGVDRGELCWCAAETDREATV